MTFEKKLKTKMGVSIPSAEDNPSNTVSWENLGITPSGENGEYTHQICPKCSKKALLSDIKTGHYFCEHCFWEGCILGESLSQRINRPNKNIEKPWWKDVISPDAFYKYLSEKYFIDRETIDKLGIKYQRHYFSREGKLRGSIVIPSFSSSGTVLNYHFLPLDKELNILEHPESLNKNIIGLDSLDVSLLKDDVHTEQCKVFIVNSPLDYIILKQTFGDDQLNRVICVPSEIDVLNFDDKKNWEFLTSIEDSIFKFKKFITLFPQTEHNEKIKTEIGRRLGFHSCSYIDFENYNDLIKNPNGEEISIFDIFMSGSEDDVRALLDHPTDYPIQGLHQLDEFEDDIDDIFENGLKPGYSLGYQQLDPFLTLKFGQWTLVTGIPGHGKSSFVEATLVNLAALHNFKIAMFSPENTPLSRFYIGLIQKASGKSYSKDPNYKGEKIGREEHEYWKNWINDRFFSILPEDNMSKSDDFSIDKGNCGSMTLSGILSLAAKAVFRHGIKILVIDPWTEVEHQRPSGMTELEYLSKSISMIKMFAKVYDVHVIVVAHPTKLQKDATGAYPVPTPYNIAGGAHWRNKGDNIISVYRNVGFPDEDITDIFIQKIRFRECGQVGSYSIRADKITNYYYDDIDQIKRRNLLERRMNPMLNKDSEAISAEEMLSTNMRLTRNFNMRELPSEFKISNIKLGNTIVTLEEMECQNPPF